VQEPLRPRLHGDPGRAPDAREHAPDRRLRPASEFWPGIEAAIAKATGASFSIRAVEPAAGGCIHRSFAVTGGSSRHFVKVNDARYADAFAAEADGLDAIVAAGVRAPRPLCHGAEGGHAWLVMEFVELGGAPDYARLGTALAKLHAVHGKSYGWGRDNYIGATPQRNAPSGDWARFWESERLAPQLELAAKNGLGSSLARAGERLLAALPRLLAGHEPRPSLLHGDLWGGNAGFLAGGEPVVFDPAVYYGDRETDLAMTELFGGFSAAFYRAYREAAPLADGYPIRRTLYNLYHVLNHANLFGGGYTAQAEGMIARLLAETSG
jgi:protein-ribulosamine 3-kinase